MMEIAGLLFDVVAYLLLFLTAVGSAHDAWKHRDLRRLDILAFVTTAFLSAMFSASVVARLAAVVLVPFLTLRLVTHFADVSRTVLWLSLLVPAISVAWAALIAGFDLPSWNVGVFLVYALALAYSGASFALATRRTVSVTRRRLFFAAAGTWLLCIAMCVAVASLVIDYRPPGRKYLTLAAYPCFYLAFATPRRLKARWQAEEQARYLSETSERDPGERGRRAAEDLARAAARVVGNATTFVALRPAPEARDLTIAAAGDPSLLNLPMPAGDNVLTSAWQNNESWSGEVGELPGGMRDALTRHGQRVLIAPVSAGVTTWGVVAAVLRRGSLFPDDDLRLLKSLGRYAATALDHAWLVAEAHARERRLAERQIREVEARMALMLDSVKDYALIALDSRGTVVNWYIGAEHVFGYSAAEMHDEPVAPLLMLSPADVTGLLEEARAVGLAGREGPCHRKDGARFVGATVIRPLVGEEGRHGFVAVTRDVTERREFEARLRQSQKMEAIGQLAGGVAHDFNNLLTAILGYSDWIRQDLSAGDPRALPVSEIQKAAERAASLTRQLLAFSRGQMLQPAVVHLPRLLDDLLPMLQRVIGTHIEITSQADHAVAPIMADRTQIEQIVLNLAVNARDAMAGGGRLSMAVRSLWLDERQAAGEVVPGAYVLLDVSDTGTGIDPAVQARIFEPFFTTKEPGQGTGLGLATVYGIVKQMAGMVRVSSEVGRGSTFHLYFPEARRRDESETQAQAVLPAEGSETILLVEDDAGVRNYLASVLERHGYRVLSAEHSTAALALAQSTDSAIDLVVTDVVMPGGSGPELARSLAQMRPDLPVLYISGYADAVLTSQKVVPKATHFLQKPFSASDLLARIRLILTPQP